MLKFSAHVEVLSTCSYKKHTIFSTHTTGTCRGVDLIECPCDCIVVLGSLFIMYVSCTHTYTHTSTHNTHMGLLVLTYMACTHTHTVSSVFKVDTSLTNTTRGNTVMGYGCGEHTVPWYKTCYYIQDKGNPLIPPTMTAHSSHNWSHPSHDCAHPSRGGNSCMSCCSVCPDPVATIC